MTDTSWLDTVKEDAKLLANINDVKLSSLNENAEKLLVLNAKKANVESILEDFQRQINELSEVLIPDIMRDLGMSKFTLLNGAEVRVDSFYSGKVIDEKAFQWLEERGYADIAKSTLTILHRRSENVDEIRHVAEVAGLDVTETTQIHHKTMSAFIKELTLKGKSLPEELFSVSFGQRASIKLPKKELENE
jgi:hypothetical protein